MLKYNATQKEIPNTSVTQYCKAAFASYADNNAVIDAAGTYTYELLHYLSNGLAQLLPKKVQGNIQQPIGIFLEKGVQQIVAVLATLWSGNYFIPIHIDTPPERIKEIMQQAQMHYMISTAAMVPLIDTVTLIDVSQIKPTQEFMAIEVSPDDLLYAIFTSGTTGVPKGVAISHRSLLNTVLAINEQFGINETDRLFALSDLSFDLAMYDVFGGLMAGAGLVFCQQTEVKEPKKWLQLIKQHQVTVWNSVPMLLSMLLEHNTQPLNLHHIFLSGDWIRVELVKKAHHLCPKAQVVSLGGPTETTIWSIHFPLQREVDYEFIPYGFPLANHQYYVLDEDLQLCRIDQVGELYAGGLGLAQGYLHDLQKTAQAFIVHPQWGRLYRTGDLGTMTQDLGIRIKGRRDRQVKIRGYRIELDDVRLALERSFIGYAVTCHVSGAFDNKRLIAYIQVPQAQSYAIIGDINTEFAQEYQALTRYLPAYMIPELFVRMNALPLNKNNKINYQALPAWSELHTQHAPAALNLIEQKIALIWSQVLKINLTQLSPHSHFFHLGGDSLRAVSVIDAVDKKFQISCSLNMLFAAPTLGDFAHRITLQKPVITKEQIILSADPKQRYEPFNLTPVQQAYWIGRQKLLELGGVSSHAYYEFDLPKVDVERFQQTLDMVIATQDMLRMVITEEGKQYVLEQVPPYPLQIFEHNLQEMLLQTREALSHEVIPMNHFPAFRVKLFQFAEFTRAVFSYDSLQFDAFSFLVFLHDLNWHYLHPQQKGQACAIQFRDYIKYLEQLTHTSLYQQSKNYWQERLPQWPSAPQLPVRPVNDAPVFLRL
jgi:amino acid adenylation domain-containing protein